VLESTSRRVAAGRSPVRCQTPLNLASGEGQGIEHHRHLPESIDTAEDRKLFAAVLDAVKLKSPANRIAMSEAEALSSAAAVG